MKLLFRVTFFSTKLKKGDEELSKKYTRLFVKIIENNIDHFKNTNKTKKGYHKLNKVIKKQEYHKLEKVLKLLFNVKKINIRVNKKEYYNYF